VVVSGAVVGATVLGVVAEAGGVDDGSPEGVLGAVGAGVPVGSEAFVDVTALADVLAGTAVLVVGVVVGAAAPPQPAARRTITDAASSDTRTARFTTGEWLILFIARYYAISLSHRWARTYGSSSASHSSGGLLYLRR
jgi:hypothetical protein